MEILSESLGRTFLKFAIFCAFIGFITFFVIDYFFIESTYLESTELIVPETKLIVKSNVIDTIYVYKKP